MLLTNLNTLRNGLSLTKWSSTLLRPRRLYSIVLIQKHIVYPAAMDTTEQLTVAKIIGVFVHSGLKCDNHVVFVLSVCSEWVYLLKLLRDRIGVCSSHNTPYNLPVPYSLQDTQLWQMWTDFQNSFTAIFVRKFCKYVPQRYPQHLNYVATLPW